MYIHKYLNSVYPVIVEHTLPIKQTKLWFCIDKYTDMHIRYKHNTHEIYSRNVYMVIHLHLFLVVLQMSTSK